MPLKYDYIDEAILKPAGLLNPQLNVLVDGEHLYTTMLYQHSGELKAEMTNDKFIGNADQAVAKAKHLKLFERALVENCDLLLTPEYSCPVETLHDCLAADLFPAEGKLWVIGCESMRPPQLRDFIEKHNAPQTYIFAETPAKESTENKILDPVSYLFRCRTQTGELAKVILFQFKVFPMGSVGIEAENLLFGTKRYVFRNDEDSIYLATIVCSESLHIDLAANLRQFRDKGYVLLHPQMNKSPRTYNLRKYRTDFFNGSEKDAKKDLICLNWAAGSKIGTEDIGYSNSALYTKAEKINVSDDRISGNDQYGLYFNDWASALSSTLVFHTGEAVFLFENSKASKRTLPPQNQGRYGPHMLDRRTWSGEDWISSDIDPDPAFLHAAAAIGCDFTPLRNPALTSINKERLLSLSVGEISNEKWAEPKSNRFFATGDEEKSYRFCVYQDPETRDNKRAWLTRFASLEQYLTHADLIPTDSHLSDLVNGLSIHYEAPQFHYNVTGDEQIPACIIYLGDADKAKVEEIKADLINSAKKDSAYRSRLMILYLELGTVTKNYERQGPSITGNNTGNPVAANKRTA